MNDRPTPETDAFFRSFADGDATPSHAEYYDRMTQLERERDEAREWKDMLSGWGGTPEIVNEFIKGQQSRIHAVQDIERERDEAREEVKRIRRWATLSGAIQIQRELTKVREQRDKLVEAIRFVLEDSEIACGHFWPDVLKKCQEALAAVEGGKP